MRSQVNTAVSFLLVALSAVLVPSLASGQSESPSIRFPIGDPLTGAPLFISTDFQNPADDSSVCEPLPVGCYQGHLAEDWDGAGWDAGLVDVYPIAEGEIVFAKKLPISTCWGNVVIVRHDDLIAGSIIYSMYAHLGAIELSSGSVGTNDVLGRSGATDCWGPHFHLEVFEYLTPPPAEVGPGRGWARQPAVLGASSIDRDGRRYFRPSEFIQDLADGQTNPPSSDVFYVSFVEGNPGIPGDGVLLSNPSEIPISIPGSAPIEAYEFDDPVSLSNLQDEITISLFSNQSADSRVYMRVVVPGFEDTCRISIIDLPNQFPVVNGVPGVAGRLRRSTIEGASLDSAIQSGRCPAETTASDFVITYTSLVVQDVNNFRYFALPLDAVAVGFGSGVFPDSSTEPPVPNEEPPSETRVSGMFTATVVRLAQAPPGGGVLTNSDTLELDGELISVGQEITGTFIYDTDGIWVVSNRDSAYGNGAEVTFYTFLPGAFSVNLNIGGIEWESLPQRPASPFFGFHGVYVFDDVDLGRGVVSDTFRIAAYGNQFAEPGNEFGSRVDILVEDSALAGVPMLIDGRALPTSLQELNTTSGNHTVRGGFDINLNSSTRPYGTVEFEIDPSSFSFSLD